MSTADFLAKNLSNFVSLPGKLHNQYCHNACLYYYVKVICIVTTKRKKKFVGERQSCRKKCTKNGI